MVDAVLREVLDELDADGRFSTPFVLPALDASYNLVLSADGADRTDLGSYSKSVAIRNFALDPAEIVLDWYHFRPQF